MQILSQYKIKYSSQVIISFNYQTIMGGRINLNKNQTRVIIIIIVSLEPSPIIDTYIIGYHWTCSIYMYIYEYANRDRFQTLLSVVNRLWIY